MADLDNIKWWANTAHKFVTTFGVLGLGVWHWVLWIKDKEEAVNWFEKHLERRTKNMGNILTYLGMAKYAIPVIDAVVAEVKATVPVEKADVVAAVASIEKAIGDLKAAIEATTTAVKAAIAQS